MIEECCINCGATENLTEGGGQFSGHWLICCECRLEQEITHKELTETFLKLQAHPMIVKESDDPCVYDTVTGEFVFVNKGESDG